MSQEQRFTAWFSRDERRQIKAEADKLHTTMNFVVRTAVREHFGIQAPTASQVSQVTNGDPAHIS